MYYTKVLRMKVSKDLTSKDFWLMSLHSYDEVIAEFKRLVKMLQSTILIVPLCS